MFKILAYSHKMEAQAIKETVSIEFREPSFKQPPRNQGQTAQMVLKTVLSDSSV